MANLEVIYDPAKEIGAVVNLDNGTPLGPVMIGPAAGDILQAWLDATPFDVAGLDAFTAQSAFLSFLERNAPPDEVASDASDNGQVVAQPGVTADDAVALADREAVHASDVPDAQPADTDSEAQENPVTVTVRCWNCEGTGMVSFGDDQADARCGMCDGTGKIQQAATS